MKPSDDKSSYEAAVKNIQEVMYGCLQCGAWVTDGTSIAGKSAADAMAEIEHIFQRFDLAPTDEAHDPACEYADNEEVADG